MNDGMLELLSAEWLVPFVLLALRERDSYEHELVEKMSDFGLEVMPPGLANRALWQMQEEGMVIRGHDGSDGGPYRQRHSITEAGEAYLEFWADSLARYQEEVDLFMRIYSGAARRVRG